MEFRSIVADASTSLLTLSCCESILHSTLLRPIASPTGGNLAQSDCKNYVSTWLCRYTNYCWKSFVCVQVEAALWHYDGPLPHWHICQVLHFSQFPLTQLHLMQKSIWTIDKSPCWQYILRYVAASEQLPTRRWTLVYPHPYMVKAHSKLRSAEPENHAWSKSKNYRIKIGTALVVRAKILMNGGDDLLLYWQTYNHSGLPCHPWGQTWNRLNAWLRLLFIFAVHCATNCKSRWWSSVCSSHTINVDKWRPTGARGYKDGA